MRGFAACLQGSQEKGVLEAKGVYNAGDVRTTRYMEEAYKMGRNA